MCLLHNRTELESSIPSLEGFKIFYRSPKNGNLYSPFVNARHVNNESFISPAFEINKVISVQPEDKTFFSFKEFEDACWVQREVPQHIASNKFFFAENLVVRPVTAIDIVATGSFFFPSHDPGKYPSRHCYESKKLIVHDTPAE